MTSNQFYGGLNKRFDRRAKLLRSLAYKYQSIAEGVAAFVRKNWMGRQQIIVASTVLYANNFAFNNEMAERRR